MRIGDRDLHDGVLVVAEIGNNHEGDPGVARELVHEAVAAGAHAVKLQVFEPDLFVRRRDEERHAQLSRFRLAPEVVEELAALAGELGAPFIATPLDLESAGRLESLVDAYKVASGDNDFWPLLDRIAATGKPVIISSGLVDLEGIRRSKEFVEDCWRQRDVEQELAVLHCVTSYPAEPADSNLAAIPALAEELGCVVGYSDHTIGNEACVLAAALGARILEKHFTLRHDFSDFRDHQLSADPAELRDLVMRVEAALELAGMPEKAVQPSEASLATAVRRSIAAAADLPAGRQIEESDLVWLRPRDGLAPGQEDQLVGRVLRRDLAAGESILPEDVE